MVRRNRFGKKRAKQTEADRLRSLSLGSALDELGFRPLGRRILVPRRIPGAEQPHGPLQEELPLLCSEPVGRHSVKADPPTVDEVQKEINAALRRRRLPKE
jgi:hypothetical protein